MQAPVHDSHDQADDPRAVADAALAEELDFIHRDLDRQIARAQAMRRSVSDDLSLADRSDVDRLLRNRNLNDADRIALCIFRKRLANSGWLQIKDRKYNVLGSVGIAVTSFPDYGSRIAKCTLRGHFCQLPDHCHGCAYWKRQGPALAKYAGAYQRCLDRGWFVHAITASYEVNPEKAGLRLVLKKRTETSDKRDRLHSYRPFAGEASLSRSPMRADSDPKNLDAIRACLRSPFDWIVALKRAGLIVGAFGHRALEIGFAPHWVVPHAHLAVVTPSPITVPVARVMYRRFIRWYARSPGGRVLYPELHVSPLRSQMELNNWLVYSLRPLDLAKPYGCAIDRGADMATLNAEVEEFYQGGDLVLREVTSPRSWGCMRFGTDGYVGTGDTVTARRNAAAAQRKKEGHTGRRPGTGNRKSWLQPMNAGRAEAERRIAAACAQDGA